MKDLKGIAHEAPIIKSPYLKNLLKKQIEVAFADRACKGIAEFKFYSCGGQILPNTFISSFNCTGLLI
jgi:hypothetical protein